MLVVDTPECCDECDISLYDKDKQEIYCPFAGFMNFELGKMGIHEDCPLKNMPVKEPCNEYDFEHFVTGRSIGWNDCVDYLNNEGRWCNWRKKDESAQKTKMSGDEA